MSQKRKNLSLPELSLEARSEARKWLESRRGELPVSVISALALTLQLADCLTSAEQNRRGILTQLRRALGITPSSERRRKSGTPLDNLPDHKKRQRLSPLEAFLSDMSRSKRLAKWYRKLARHHDRKAKKIEEAMVEFNEDELSAEVLAEIEAEQKESEARFELGQRCDLDCAPNAESLMTGSAVLVQSEEEKVCVDRDSLPRGAVIKQQFFEDRERLSFSFSVTKINIAVEKLSVQTRDGMTLVTASTEELGPPKSKVTWEFLASMAVLVAQYALPLNRFAALASSPVKVFKASEIARHFQYVASRFVAIYLQLAKDLANSPVLLGDDTSSRVIEVTKGLKESALNSEAVVPWAGYATQEQATKKLREMSTHHKDPGIAVKLAESLGFEFDRKDGTGTKIGFNTSVLSGRSDPYDPKSQIIFFRSHLGGFGNLLSVILKHRRPDNPNLVIQSDLATVNLISDPALSERLQVTYAGCAYHARRPFAIHQAQDPELCEWILHEFKGLAIFEGGLDAAGRNRDNTTAVRDTDERETWEQIKYYAYLIAKKWSAASELGKAARYIIKNYEKLTYYLQDHRLAISNNFSERMLRLERLIENNALFRQTLGGRFSLDIIRTVLQTAIAAKVDLQLYLMWVMSMPAEVVDAAPADFTPLAFARLKSQHIAP